MNALLTGDISHPFWTFPQLPHHHMHTLLLCPVHCPGADLLQLLPAPVKLPQAPPGPMAFCGHLGIIRDGWAAAWAGEVVGGRALVPQNPHCSPGPNMSPPSCWGRGAERQ